MKTLRRIALALVVIGAINWGLIGLFGFNLVGAIFGNGGFARFIYTLVGIGGIICIGLLFNADTVDVPAREESQGFTNTSYATEFAEEPDLERLYNPSRDAYENEDIEDEDELV
ncbi:DUF378 domain-containing protein [Bacillus sp. FJAT-50079]|uniref:DUF378 domain-containing protein n=1 Tax=Bacillus sp. FJAT-50079 TaxID=2833577 RepID=UPI001BC9C597|nr:DUF378 domain-containing protein [Bacillus sp. FJAT-50079]